MILRLFITLPLIGYSIGQLHITCFDSRSSARYCLSYINKNATWEKANSYCMERNGTLADLEKSGINSKISSSLKSASIDAETCWVGGYRHNSSWLWLNGHTIAQNQWFQDGDCVMLSVKAGVIVNYLCDKERPFICQFNIDHYTFCVPGISQPHEMCYTYVKPGSISWCSARKSCFERGGDLASLDYGVSTWGQFLIDVRATTVFVGAAFNLTRWQWLDGKTIDLLNKTLLENSKSSLYCAALAGNAKFVLFPMRCNEYGTFSFICGVGQTRRESINEMNICGDLMAEMQKTTKKITATPKPTTTLYQLSSTSFTSQHTHVTTSKQLTLTTPILSSIRLMSISSFYENITKTEGQPISSNIHSTEKHKPDNSMIETTKGSSIMTSVSSSTPTTMQLARSTYKQAVMARDTITPTITPSNEERNSSDPEKNTTTSTISPPTKSADSDNQTAVNTITPLIISSQMDSKASNKQKTNAPRTDSMTASSVASSVTLLDKVLFTKKIEDSSIVILSTTKSNKGINHETNLTSTEKITSSSILPTFTTTATIKTKSMQDSTQTTEERTETLSPKHLSTELTALNDHTNTRTSTYMVPSTTNSTQLDGKQTLSMIAEVTKISTMPFPSTKAPKQWTTRETITTATVENVTVTSVSFITTSVLKLSKEFSQESTSTEMFTTSRSGISTNYSTFFQGDITTGIRSISTPLPIKESLTSMKHLSNLTETTSKLSNLSSSTKLSTLSSQGNISIASPSTISRVTKLHIESTTESYLDKVDTITTSIIASTTPIIASSTTESTSDLTKWINNNTESLSSTLTTITDSTKWINNNTESLSSTLTTITDSTKWINKNTESLSSTMTTITDSTKWINNNTESLSSTMTTITDSTKWINNNTESLSSTMTTITDSKKWRNHEATKPSISTTAKPDSIKWSSLEPNGPSSPITTTNSSHLSSQNKMQISSIIPATKESATSSTHETIKISSTITTNRDSSNLKSQETNEPSPTITTSVDVVHSTSQETTQLSLTTVTTTNSDSSSSQKLMGSSSSIMKTTDLTTSNGQEPDGQPSTITKSKEAGTSNRKNTRFPSTMATTTELVTSGRQETTRSPSTITTTTDIALWSSQGTNGQPSNTTETAQLSTMSIRERPRPLSTITKSTDSKLSMSQNITVPTSVITMTTEPAYSSSQRRTELSLTMADSATSSSRKQNVPSNNIKTTLDSATFNSQETTHPSSFIKTTTEATTSNSQKTARLSSILTTTKDSATSCSQTTTEILSNITTTINLVNSSSLKTNGPTSFIATTSESATSSSQSSNGLLSTMTGTTESGTSSEQQTTRISSTIIIATDSAPSNRQETTEISSAIPTTTVLGTSNYQELNGPASILKKTTRSATFNSQKTTFPITITSESFNSISHETIKPSVTITTTTEYANSSDQGQNGLSPTITISTDSANASNQEITGLFFTITTTTDTPISKSEEITRPYSTITLALDVNSSNQETTGSSYTIPTAKDSATSSSQESNGQPSIIKTSSEFTSSTTEMELLFPTTGLLTPKLSYIPSPRESTTVAYNETNKSEKAVSVASITASMTESTILGNREASAAATRPITSYSNEATDVDKISSVTPSTLQLAPLISTVMGITETISFIELLMEKSSTVPITNYVASKTGETSSKIEHFQVSIDYKSDTVTKLKIDSSFTTSTAEIPNISSQRAMTTAEHETGLPEVSKAISPTLPFTQSSAAKSTADTYAKSKSPNMSVSQPLITNKAINTSQVTTFHALTTTKPSPAIMNTSTVIPSKSVIDPSSTFSTTFLDTTSSQSLFKSSETDNQTIKSSTESTLELTHTRYSSFVTAPSTRQKFTGTSEVFDDKVSTHGTVSIINPQSGQSPQRVVIISAAIGGAIAIVVAIVVIILLRRRRLAMIRRHLAARNSNDYTSFYEYSQNFPLRISRNDQIASFNPLYEATNVRIPRLSFSRGYRTAEI